MNHHHRRAVVVRSMCRSEYKEVVESSSGYHHRRRRHLSLEMVGMEVVDRLNWKTVVVVMAAVEKEFADTSYRTMNTLCIRSGTSMKKQKQLDMVVVVVV